MLGAFVRWRITGMGSALPQNPHAVRDSKENNLERAIGHEVRTCRKKLGITVADLASDTGLSVGMLSKIENGAISHWSGRFELIVDDGLLSIGGRSIAVHWLSPVRAIYFCGRNYHFWKTVHRG